MGVLFSSLPVVYLHFLLNDRVSSNSSEHSVYQFFLYRWPSVKSQRERIETLPTSCLEQLEGQQSEDTNQEQC